jgi:Rps23 Pro-64 3,4-dihydroxylase Tpa1-like proline 4-hydroxylase
VAVVAVVAIGFVRHPTQMPAKDWPVDALAFIQQHPDQFAGHMFNQYAWGGYLMQELPEHKVFVDGRTDFYGETLLKEFEQTTALRSNWVAVLDKYDVAWTLMPSDHRLNLALALLQPQWSCIYTDSVAAIWRKVE